jgi:hypothetical protein
MKIEAAQRLRADKKELHDRMRDLKHSLESTTDPEEKARIQKTIADLKEIIRTSI